MENREREDSYAGGYNFGQGQKSGKSSKVSKNQTSLNDSEVNSVPADMMMNPDMYSQDRTGSF